MEANHAQVTADPPTAPTQVRQVNFVTPVLLGANIDGVSLASELINYTKGQRINYVPHKITPTTDARGMVVELPEDHLALYVDAALAWLKLPSDQALIAKLQEHLRMHDANKPQDRVSISAIDLLSSALFAGMDTRTQSNIVAALEHPEERPKLPHDVHDTEIRGVLATGLIHKKRLPTNNRDAKLVAKECEIVRLHQVEGMKPAAIARKMRVAAAQVYKIVERFKMRANKQKLVDDEVVAPPKEKHADDKKQEMQKLILEYIQLHGVHGISLQAIQAYMREHTLRARVPTQ